MFHIITAFNEHSAAERDRLIKLEALNISTISLAASLTKTISINNQRNGGMDQAVSIICPQKAGLPSSLSLQCPTRTRMHIGHTGDDRNAGLDQATPTSETNLRHPCDLVYTTEIDSRISISLSLSSSVAGCDDQPSDSCRVKVHPTNPERRENIMFLELEYYLNGWKNLRDSNLRRLAGEDS